MNDPGAQMRFNTVRWQVRYQMAIIEQNVPHATNLVAWWDQWTDDYFQLVATRAQQWALDAITRAEAPYAQAAANQQQLRTAESVQSTRCFQFPRRLPY